jgi:COMPASS component SWD2
MDSVFAVVINHYSRILLYDQANFDKAPFLVITLGDPTLSLVGYPPRPIYMTSLSFSSNGKYLLVGCSGDAHYVSRAISWRKSRGTWICGEEASWSPDSKYVVGGSLDGVGFAEFAIPGRPR